MVYMLQQINTSTRTQSGRAGTNNNMQSPGSGLASNLVGQWKFMGINLGSMPDIIRFNDNGRGKWVKNQNYEQTFNWSVETNAGAINIFIDNMAYPVLVVTKSNLFFRENGAKYARV